MARWTNRAAWIVLCGIIGGGSAVGQQSPTTVRFDAPLVQLGEVRSGVPKGHRFAFVNQCTNEVEITAVRPGCGCLKPRLERQTYQPGERGAIPVDINTLGQAAGPHTWQMTVVFREGDRLIEQSLQVMAHVVTEVTVQPAALTLFAEHNARHEICVMDLRREPLTILRVEATSPHLRGQAGPFVQSELGHFVCKIKLDVSADLPAGRNDERLVIHTSDPFYRELSVPVTIVKRAPK